MMQRKYETIVGLFVVASLAALLVMVVLIAQEERLWQEHVGYQAIFKNISGLKAGSEVRLAGVTVGSVKEITINPQGQIVVTFEVLAKYQSRIRQDSRASIGFIGLLGEKSLDISTGPPDKPVIPPDGLVASVEPIDMTELFARAQPSLENLQKILNNLASLTEGLMEPKGDFAKSFHEIRQIITKVDQGKGTLGLIVNDPVLYQEATKTVAATGKFMTDLTQAKGLMGTLISDQAFKAQAQKTLSEMEATFAHMKQSSADFKAAASRLPAIAQKGEAFLDSLNKAGKGLLTSGEEMVSDADKVAKGAQRSWLLRWNIPKSKERTLQVEREPGKD
jgi:phospholipid/cholesterol/gamma-HCH transport system substrate-binding protein